MSVLCQKIVDCFCRILLLLKVAFVQLDKSDKRSEMFGRRVVAVVWNEMNRNGNDKRTRFIANYILDDGFDSLSECNGIITLNKDADV